MKNNVSFPHTSIDNDKEAWQKFLAGDQHAFTVLIHRNGNKLFNYGMNIYSDRELIHDLLQDFFADLWKNRTTIGAAQQVTAYLMTSFRRNILRYLKYHQKTTCLDGFLNHHDLIENRNSEVRIVEKETEDYKIRQLYQGMEQLPQRQREAIYLRYYQSLRPEEIAQVMGVSHQVVRNMLHRALKQLRASVPRG